MLSQKPTACCVCETETPFLSEVEFQGGQAWVCLNFECRNFLKQNGFLPQALFNAQLASFRGRIINDRKSVFEIQQKTEATVKSREAENRQIEASVITDYEPVLKSVQLPSGRKTLTPISADRIRRYREHLERVIDDAINYDLQAEDDDQNRASFKRLAVINDRFRDNPAIESIADKLCSMCKGGCCATGEDHGYLSAFSLRRVMDSALHKSPQDLLEEYLALLGRESIDQSCINQTAQGCALPRAMRSDICNSFYCQQQKILQVEILEAPWQGPILVIQRANTLSTTDMNPEAENPVVQVAVVEENNIRYIDKSVYCSEHG